MDCQEFKEIISAYVDGALSPSEQLTVQHHLDRCSRCRQIASWEAKAAKALKQSLSLVSPRSELKQKLLDRLAESDERSHWNWLCAPRAWIPALTVILIMGASYYAWRPKAPEDAFADTVSQYRRVIQGMEVFARHPAPALAAQPLDLSPWGYQLLGIQARKVNGRERRVFVYRGQKQELVVAQEIEGTEFSPPRGSSVVKVSGRDLVSHSEGHVNLVAWKDKKIICVLASALPKASLIDLARQIAARG